MRETLEDPAMKQYGITDIRNVMDDKLRSDDPLLVGRNLDIAICPLNKKGVDGFIRNARKAAELAGILE